MGKLLHLLLDFVPGGPVIRGLAGGLFGLAQGGNFFQHYQQASNVTVVVNRSTGEIIFLVWFLTLLTGYFIPPLQPYVVDGFEKMTATLPQAWQEDLHWIVMALFGANVAHKYIDNKNSNTREGNPTHHFLFN